MAITVDWSTFVINVPQADLTFLGGSLYQLDVDAFRLELKSIEASNDGMAFTDTHSHRGELTLAGVTYARSVEILSPYTITFEDGNYRVITVGANHNISDVMNLNSVQLITNNSAGLVVVGGFGGIA